MCDTLLKSRVHHWLNCDLEGSFVFLWENLQRYLSFGKCFLKKYWEASKKKEGKKSLEDLALLVSPAFARRAAKHPKTGLRWSKNSNCSNRKLWSTYKGRKIEWLALFFSKKAISNVGKRKVKVTENCVENTDFAYAATSRPGHMPRQLPARLSGIGLWSIVRAHPQKGGCVQ